MTVGGVVPDMAKQEIATGYATGEAKTGLSTTHPGATLSLEYHGYHLFSRAEPL